MSRSPDHRQRLETRLDALIDDLNAGDAATASDAEFVDLAVIVRAIHGVDDVEWPDSAFPDQLVARIYAEFGSEDEGILTTLVVTQRATVEGTQADAPISMVIANPEDTFDVLGPPARPFRPRRLAQIAAAIVVFGLLTLVLAAVFRGFDDDQPGALGGTEARPAQLAVTMQTDPVNGNPDIFLVSLDGSDPVNLTNHPANDTMPAWSPDGKRLAFISDRSGSDRLYVMFTDGRGVREIDPLYLYDPEPGDGWHFRNFAWSPDGSAIAVMRFPIGGDAGDAEVLIVAANGTGFRRLVMESEYMDLENPELVFDQTPKWSPDSQWLVFEIRNEDETRLAISGRGAGYLVLPLSAIDSGTATSWSVNNEIAIARPDGIGILDFTGDPDSLISDEVRHLPAPDGGPVTGVEWSPDGSRLAVSVGSVSGASIWIVSADGSESFEVPTSLTGVYPTWSPDGSQLAFLRAGLFSADSFGHDLMIYDVETSTLTTLVDTMFSGPLQSAAVWRLEPGPEYSQSPTAVLPTVTSTVESDVGVDDPLAQEAIDQVRAFLDDPTAELSVDGTVGLGGRTILGLSRPVPGMEDDGRFSDQFAVDLDGEMVFRALLMSNTTLAQPENPVTVDEARAIAEAFYREHDTFGDELEIADELPHLSDAILDTGHEVSGHEVVWQRKVNGVWLPTTVRVLVDLQTGLVISYVRFDIPYDATLTPAIDQGEAHDIARAAIAEDPDLAGSTIDRVRLTVAFGALDEAIPGSYVEGDLEARLRLAWEFRLTGRPSPEADDVLFVDAETGQVLVTGS